MPERNRIYAEAAMKIALMSVADIGNFGDMLFPLVARELISAKLKQVGFRFFCPTEQKIEGEHFYAYSRTEVAAFEPDAILAIGGEVIHRYHAKVWSEMYDFSSMSGRPSDTFYDWLDLNNVFKAWFSVGALDLPYPGESTTWEELACLDYVAVRGLLSKKILEQKMFHVNLHIDLVPDIGWVFPRYFGNHERYTQKMGLQDGSYMVFNANRTSIPVEKLTDVKNSLTAFREKTGLHIVVMPMGPARYSPLPPMKRRLPFVMKVLFF
jgi:hypothetical protein